MNYSNKVLHSRAIPNPMIRIPAERFIHFIVPSVSLFPSQPTPALRNIHQAAEPRKTPATNRKALARNPAWALIPPNSAMKEKIVTGLLSVSRKVDT